MTAEPEREPELELDKRIAKSVSHPIRIGIMRILRERTASPSELAEALGEGVSHVSYHVSELCKYGAVELVDTKPSRGAIEHFYRATRSSLQRIEDDEAEALSDSERNAILATSLQIVVSEALGAIASGNLHARHDIHTTWMFLELDEQGWREVTAILYRALNEVEAAKSMAADRLGEDGAEGFSALVSMLAFVRGESP